MRRRIELLSIVLAIAGAAGHAEAQEEGEYWIDMADSNDTAARPRSSSGSASLDDARAGGGALVITGSGGGVRDVPPTHTVRSGDTLWDITQRYYGNPYDWPRIWSFNPEITNPHWIYPLDQVRLMPEGVSTVQPRRGTRIVARAADDPGTVYLREQGYLDPEALRSAGEIVGSPSDHMLLSPFDEVYVHFDELEGGRAPEGEYTIFREIPESERTRGEQGTLVRILGALRIVSWDADRSTARATLIEALEPIERGYRVAAVPRRFDVVPPVRSDRDVDTEVVASLSQREVLGDQQIVFVPLGEEDGLRAGHRLYIVRAGDEWRLTYDDHPRDLGSTTPPPEEPEEYPDEVIAEGRVVSTRAHSSAVLVTRAVRPVEIGDRAQLRRGY